MMKTSFVFGRRFGVAAFCGCLALGAFGAEEGAAVAAADPAMEAEIKYVQALIESNYPDLADSVIAAARKRWRDAGPRLAALEMTMRLRLGKFDEVKEAIAKTADKTSSEYWAMNLALGDAYYAQNKFAECAAIYKEFFAKVGKPKADIRKLYIDSAFKWAQMLSRDGKDDEAAKTYDNMLPLLAGPEDEDLWCAVALADCETLLKLAEGSDGAKREGYVARADKLISKMLWKQELIIVFGRAVAMRAHTELLRGRLDKAQKTVEGYLPRLRDIHDSLVEQDPTGSQGFLRMSPMPQCRYLLAEMMWKAAQKALKTQPVDEEAIKNLLFGEKVNGKRNGAGAYNHAINVFVKYPESTWASKAGDMAEQIEKFVKERYKTAIKTQITPEQREKVVRMQFAEADELYRNNDFAAAAKAYMQPLSQFPEGLVSVQAIGNLLDSWLKVAADLKNKAEKDDIYMNVEAVEGYLGERFGGLSAELMNAAGNQVIRFATRENDLGFRARSQRLYDLYFANYRNHHQAAQLAASLAGVAAKAEDWALARRYYSVIVENYPKSPYYESALNGLAICAAKLGDHEAEIAWLRKYGEACKSSSGKANAQFRLAYAAQREGVAALKAAATNENASAESIAKVAAGLKSAIAELERVATLADAAAKDPVVSAADKGNFAKMRENAMFLIADTTQRMPAMEGAADPREAAAAAYDRYLAEYPKGSFAPSVLVRLGTIYIAQTNTVKQQEVFQRLEKEFPDTDEAKNSKPRLARALVDMGMQSEGIKQYSEMLRTDGKYTAGQFLAAGSALLEAHGREAMETAVVAFEKSLSKAGAGDTGIIGAARLGKAKALSELGRMAEAQDMLESIISDKQLSRTTIVNDANRLVIEVASKAGAKEKNDDIRAKCFGTAIKAIKDLRRRIKDDPRMDQELDLEQGEVLKRRLDAELAMGEEKKEQAEKTRGLAAASFQTFVLAHMPDDNHPASEMQGYELDNLERALSSLLPLMAAQGDKEQAEKVVEYGERYLSLFPNGRHRTDVMNAVNQAKTQL